MADFQRVVEYLRDIRLSPPPAVTDELRQYASEYAELCTSANERLRQCSTLLQQGLRSEAIHLADESPNLLDLVAALDLPEAAQFGEFCQAAGLPVAPPLQMDRANQLNDAYAADQPLEHLLAQHRLLALARAPVKDRLAVMRALATADPTLGASGFWEKDLRVFERSRIRELPTLFYTAVRNRDFVAITDLAREIEQSPWLEPLPADLREGVADAFTRMNRAKVEDALRGMVPALRDAFAARSLPDCTALLRKWRDTIKGAGVNAIATDLAAEVDPIIAWVQQENELAARQKSFTAACEQFAAALDAHTPIPQLEPAWEKLKKFDITIPEDLQRRYEQRLQERVAAARRRFVVTLGAIGAGVAAILVVIGLVVFLYLRSSSAESWARRMEVAVHAHNLDNATRLVADLEKRAPHLKSNPLVAAALEKVRQLQDEHDRDATTLSDLLTRLADASAKAAPLTTAPTPVIEDLLAEASKLDEVLARATAHDLTWVDNNHKLAEAVKAADSLRATFRAKAGSLIRAQVETLGKEFDAIPENPTGAELAPALSQVNALASKAATLRDLPGLDETVKTDVTKLLARLDARRDAMDKAKDQWGELTAIAQKATSADELKKAMEEFVAKFPNSPATADFTKALESMPVAKAVEAWKAQVAAWGIGPTTVSRLAPTGAAEATKRAEALQAYATANPASPFAAPAAAYAEYLKQAADGMADKNTWQTAFADITSMPLYTELAYMQDSAGKKYYVLGDIKLTQRRINNLVTVTFDSINPNPKELAKRITITIEPPNKLVSDKPALLPHARFLTEAADKIKFLGDSDWDTFGFDLIDNLINNTDMDLVVKSILLQTALKTNKQITGWATGDVYDKALQDFGRQQLDDIIWYDTEHPVPDSTRQALTKIIQSIPKKQTTLALYNQRKSAIFKGMLFDYASKGVLLKNDKGAWAIFVRDSSADGYKAWAAVAPAAADQPGTLTPIATYKDGKFALDESALGTLPQGTMIFTAKP